MLHPNTLEKLVPTGSFPLKIDALLRFESRCGRISMEQHGRGKGDKDRKSRDGRKVNEKLNKTAETGPKTLRDWSTKPGSKGQGKRSQNCWEGLTFLAAWLFMGRSCIPRCLKI